MSTIIVTKRGDTNEEEIQDGLDDTLEDSPYDMVIAPADHERIGVSKTSSDATTIEDLKAIVRQVKARIEKMTAEKVPYFTMEAIRNVHEQVQKCMAQGGKGDVFVKGLDGITVRFQVDIGKIYDHADFIRYVVFNSIILNRMLRVYSVKPYIEYVSMEHLTSEKWAELLNKELAFCNILVCHRVKYLDKETRKPITANDAIRPKEDVRRDFDKNLHEWMSSEQCRQLRSLDILRQDAGRIKKIVAFACGSITHSDERSEGRSSYQHALIKTLRDTLSQARHEDDNLTKEQKEEHIQCFIQDPAYTRIDRELLQDDYGIATILGNPEGFLEVDDSTVVLSFAPNVPVRQIVIDVAKPAVMIWNRIWDEDDEDV